MSPLSHLAETLSGSEIVKLGNEINDRISKGEKIYNFTIGDFDPSIFPIPKALEQLIIEAYQKHFTNYPPANGLSILRQSVSKFIQQWEGIHYPPEEILIASGGRPLIYTAFKTIVDKADKVIYPVPSWNNNHYVHLTGGKHCAIETKPENHFMPVAEEIAPHIKGATLICLCTPQNPTGTTLNKIELEKICDLVLEENKQREPDSKKLFLLFDQMYWMLTYDDIQHYNPVTLRPDMKEFTIFIDGISKVFASTGVRVGWAFGPQKVIDKMKALLTHLGAWAPKPEQKATARFLLQNDSVNAFLIRYKSELRLRLHKIYEGFMQLKTKGFPVDAIAPQAGIYLTIQLNLVGFSVEGEKLETQADVTNYILKEASLAVVPFYAFGADRKSPWYRLSVGTCKMEELDAMFKKLESALRKLQ